MNSTWAWARGGQGHDDLLSLPLSTAPSLSLPLSPSLNLSVSLSLSDSSPRSLDMHYQLSIFISLPLCLSPTHKWAQSFSLTPHHFLPFSFSMCVCVCVCGCEREGEFVSVCMCVCVLETIVLFWRYINTIELCLDKFVCMLVCVCVRERECVCVCVCV